VDGKEGTNGVASDKPSNFSPLEANPYPKGSAEALRLDAARLEVARLRALGQMPSPQLMKEVAVAAKATAASPATAAFSLNQRE